MPRSHYCHFCGNEFPAGIGMMYVKNDGTLYWFCSSKCRKAVLKLGRDPRKFKWTKRYTKGSSGKSAP